MKTKLIVVVVVVVVFVAGGFWYWQSAKNAEVSPSSTHIATKGMTSAAANDGSWLSIKEWGIEFKKSASLPNLKYALKANSDNVGFSTEELTSLDARVAQGSATYCDASWGPVGTLTRITPSNLQPEFAGSAVRLGDYYYLYSPSQATCSENDQVRKLQTDQRAVLLPYDRNSSLKNIIRLQTTPSSSSTQPPSRELKFDLDTIKVGDTVGVFAVDSIYPYRAGSTVTPNKVIIFSGTGEIEGTYEWSGIGIHYLKPTPGEASKIPFESAPYTSVCLGEYETKLPEEYGVREGDRVRLTFDSVTLSYFPIELCSPVLHVTKAEKL